MGKRLFAAVLSGLLSGGFGCAALAADGAPPLTIEARLFGSKTGRLSENVFGPNGPALGNVIIGDDPSVSTLVTVKVARGGPLGDKARIRLVATEIERPELWRGNFRPRRLVDKSVARPLFDEGQEAAHLGFWLQPTGCVPINLVAELLDPPRRMVQASARLEFRCYE